MREINVTVIGSGSTYCPELIYGFIEAKDSLKWTGLMNNIQNTVREEIMHEIVYAEEGLK